jgi:serine/threonine protein kinase
MDASDASVSPQATPRTGPPRITGPKSDYGELLVVDPQHYAIADELARGGMGRIVRAHDRRLGRPVAIKELLPGGRSDPRHRVVGR